MKEQIEKGLSVIDDGINAEKLDTLNKLEDRLKARKKKKEETAQKREEERKQREEEAILER